MILPNNGDTSDPLTVESIDNHVYFYSDVNSDRGLALMKQIREMDGRLRNERISRSLPEEFPLTPIWLHIQSWGGDLFAGLAISDHLKNISSPIYSIVEGVCASAGTLISMACDMRYIFPSAFILIHPPAGGVWGTYEKFKDEMKLQEMALEWLVNFYVEHSNLSAAKIKKFLERDSWFSSKECLEYGFVDGILS